MPTASSSHQPLRLPFELRKRCISMLVAAFGHEPPVVGRLGETAGKRGLFLTGALCWAAAVACGDTSRRPGAEPEAGAAGSGGSITGITAGSPAGGAAGAGAQAGDDDGLAGAAGAGTGGEAPTEKRPIRALQITTGRDHSCALLENHQVKCWGENSYGELGQGDQKFRGQAPGGMGDELPFVQLGTGRTAKAISAGRYSTCALLDDDTVKCWGLPKFVDRPLDNYDIGDGPDEMGDALPPLAFGASRVAKAVGIGHDSACALLDDGSYQCNAGAYAETIPGPSGIAPVSVTGSFGILVLYDDGSVRSIAPAEPPTTPKLLVPSGAVKIAGSMALECALLGTGALQCFGQYKDYLPLALPSATELGLSERGILCAIVGGGAVRCFGQIGAVVWGTAVQVPASADVPYGTRSIDVPLDKPAVQLSSAAREQQCALLADGSVTCWPWVEQAVAATGRQGSSSPLLFPVDLGTWSD